MVTTNGLIADIAMALIGKPFGPISDLITAEIPKMAESHHQALLYIGISW